MTLNHNNNSHRIILSIRIVDTITCTRHSYDIWMAYCKLSYGDCI